MKKTIFLLICLAALQMSCSNQQNNKQEQPEQLTPQEQPAELAEITTPPTELNLDTFYSKYMNVNGIHVVSSWRVPDSCFHAAFITVNALTGMLPPEVLASMIERDTRIGIMARYEGTTDIPEHAYLAADTTLNWDVRA